MESDGNIFNLAPQVAQSTLEKLHYKLKQMSYYPLHANDQCATYVNIINGSGSKEHSQGRQNAWLV